MKLKPLLASLCVSVPLMMTSMSSLAVEKITLKLAHNLDQEHVVHKALDQMAKEIQEKSDGKMRVRIYPNGQMGGPRETIEMMQNGALDMTKASASEMEPFANAFSVFSLPYAFHDIEHFKRVLYGPVGQELMKETESRGFTAIAGYVAGTRSFYAKKEIKSPADMKGMKIRVVSTPTTNKLVELLGASPVPVSFGEVYSALQQGVLDGAENNEPSYYQTRHVEVAKFYTENQHTYVPDYLVISSKVWNNMSDAQREIITTAAKNSEIYQQKLWDEEVANSRQKAQELGATFITVDKTPFREALAPLHEDFKKDPNVASWIEKIEAEAKM